MSTLGERIRRRREELGLTQSELAARLGYKSKVSISNAENDRDDMTTTRISKYANALETSEAYLMGWLDSEYLEEQHQSELYRTKMIAYSQRDFWAYHILDVGDKITRDGQKEIENFADYLASKYNLGKLTNAKEVEALLFEDSRGGLYESN